MNNESYTQLGDVDNESHRRRFAAKCELRGWHMVRIQEGKEQRRCITCGKLGDAGWAAREARQEHKNS